MSLHSGCHPGDQAPTKTTPEMKGKPSSDVKGSPDDSVRWTVPLRSLTKASPTRPGSREHAILRHAHRPRHDSTENIPRRHATHLLQLQVRALVRHTLMAHTQLPPGRRSQGRVGRNAVHVLGVVLHAERSGIEHRGLVRDDRGCGGGDGAGGT